jgi:hypothetical protein
VFAYGGDSNAPALKVHSTVTRAEVRFEAYHVAGKLIRSVMARSVQLFGARERLKPEPVSEPLTGSVSSRGREYESGTILQSEIPNAVITYGPVCRGLVCGS